MYTKALRFLFWTYVVLLIFKMRAEGSGHGQVLINLGTELKRWSVLVRPAELPSRGRFPGRNCFSPKVLVFRRRTCFEKLLTLRLLKTEIQTVGRCGVTTRGQRRETPSSEDCQEIL